MDPEDRALLARVAKLSEENHRILQKVESRAKRAAIYGFIKMAIILLPFIIGYIYLEPFIEQAMENFKSVQLLLSR